MPATLSRALQRRDLAAIVINVVIGAGILGLPGKTYALLGVYSIVAWTLCALIMALIALCFAEVGSRFTDSGGVYLYARDAFGPGTGFLVGWLAWVSRLFSFATIGNLAVLYAGTRWPTLNSGLPRVIALSIVCALLTLLLIRGIRQSRIINNAFTACKIVLLAGFALAMLPYVAAGPQWHAGPLPHIDAWQSAMLAMTYGYIGIESALINAGETRDPQRDAPAALFWGLAVIAAIYIAIQIACIGTVANLASSQRPVVDATTQVFGKGAGEAFGLASVISMLGAMFAIALTGSRLPFAIAEQKQLPRIFARVHPRFHTPHAAILLTGAMSWLVTLYFSFFGALTVSALTRLIGYVTTCAALLVLRRGAPEAAFKAPGGAATALLSLMACIWLMLSTTRAQLEIVAGLALLGGLCAGGYRWYTRGSR